MNKNQFIMTLSKHLKRLPAEERDDILTYYSEFIDEGMTMKTENEVIAEIGSPKRIAREVTADFAIKELNDKDTSVKRRSTTLWWVMAGILSSPVTLPLMVVVVALLMVAAVVSLTLVVCYAVVFYCLYNQRSWCSYSRYTYYSRKCCIEFFLCRYWFCGNGNRWVTNVTF